MCKLSHIAGKKRAVHSLCFLFVILASVSQASATTDLDSPLILSKDHEMVVQKLIDGLNRPSGMEFVNGDILIIERDSGQVKLINDFKIKKYPIADLNLFGSTRENGHTVGITASKTADGQFYLFLSYLKNTSSGAENMTSKYALTSEIYRYDLNLTGLGIENPFLVLDVPQRPNSTVDSVGGKILADSDQYIYTVVEASESVDGNSTSKERIGSPNCIASSKPSTLFRTSITSDPFNSPQYPGNDKIYVCSPSNPSLAIDPLTGNLWAAGHQKNTSQFDIIFPAHGTKYYQGCTYTNDSNKSCHFREPRFIFPNSNFTGITFANSTKLLSDSQNSLLISDLEGNIHWFKLNSAHSDLMEYQKLGTGFGPISDIKFGPDGALYVLTFSNSSVSDGKNQLNERTGALFRISNDRIPLPYYESIIAYADSIGLAGILGIVVTITIVCLILRHKRKHV